jgi:hypothetical protein
MNFLRRLFGGKGAEGIDDYEDVRERMQKALRGEPLSP